MTVKRILFALVAVLGLSVASANAQAVIVNGDVALGIDTLGQMNPAAKTLPGGVLPYNASRVGLSFFTNFTGTAAPEWGDATSPGCFCEGYGVSANGIFGYANNDSGIVNMTGDSFASTASTATVVTHLTSLPGLTIKHEYQPSASGALFEAIVTLTNTTGALMTDVRYNRTMDWDIPPTTFSEYVTIQGWPATALLDSCDDGFETPNPLADCTPLVAGTEDVNFTDVNGSDHGARFTFGFGSLAAGASIVFKIFYGAASTEALALAALTAVGAEVYSFGQCAPAESTTDLCVSTTLGGPATFIFGFSGVGGTPVPEPASMLLLGGGLAGLLVRRYRRR